MPPSKRPKVEIEIKLPEVLTDIHRWVVVGLDPSLSRTGFAFLHVDAEQQRWSDVGSCKPQSSDGPVWLRAKLQGVFLRQKLEQLQADTHTGLLIVCEYATPTDDYLNRVQAVFQTLFSDGNIYPNFARVHQLSVNASTLRSLMGLKQKGNNKGENQARAYQFIPKTDFPELDSDACDAVLLAMVGQYTAQLLLGKVESVPQTFVERLCSIRPIARGAGRNVRITTEGLLHTKGQRPEYWNASSRDTYTLQHKDARLASKRLQNITFQI